MFKKSSDTQETQPTESSEEKQNDTKEEVKKEIPQNENKVEEEKKTAEDINAYHPPGGNAPTEPKPKATKFSFIKSKKKTHEETNDNNKVAKNEGDLQKLMSVANKDTSSSMFAKLTKVDEQPPVKAEKKFGFIKKNQTQQSPANSQQKDLKFIKKESSPTPKNVEPQIKKKWTLKDVKETYSAEKGKINANMFNYNEDFKNHIRRISLLRQEVDSCKIQKENLQQEVNELTKKQNALIEENNFDDAMKVEEEIKQRTAELNSVDLSIQQKTEDELAKLKWNLIQLIKDNIDHLNNYMANFPDLTPYANEAKANLEEEEKKAMLSINNDISSQEKKTEEKDIAYKESIENLNKADEDFKLKFEEETKDLTNEIKALDDKKKNLLDEIEEIKKKLQEKENELQEVNNEIDSKEGEKEEIKKKYETDEEYMKKKTDKEEKEKEYNFAVKVLNNLKQISEDNKSQYKSKFEEISHIIKTIEDNRLNYPKKVESNKELIETLTNIFTYNEENLKKMHENENKIKEYSAKIVENNEKIEVLDLQNKRINSEIISVDANIENLEDIKKSLVAKKQFKEAQNTNNEIKKNQTNKQGLTELLDGNKQEIDSLMKDNSEQNEQSEKLVKENEAYDKQIKENNNKYIKSYRDILQDFYENVDENDSDINMIKEEMEIINKEIGEEEPKEEEKKEEATEPPKEEEKPSTNEEEKKEEEVKEEEPKKELTPEEKGAKKNELEATIKDLEVKLDEQVKLENFDECDVINTQIENLKEELKQYE